MIEEPEEFEPEYPEEDLKLLRGEYLYDGHLIGADTNINDGGHEAYIQQAICNTYAEELVSIANEILEKQKDSEESEELKTHKDQVEKYLYDDHDPDNVLSLYDRIKKISPQSVSNQKLTEAMKALDYNGDARKYGCQYLDYIIIRDENFEVWELNQDTAKKIVDAAYEMVDYQNRNMLPRQTINVGSYKTGKTREYTIGDLQEGKLFVTPTLPKTKANFFIPSLKPKKYNFQARPAGLSPTQYHQAKSTSESFSFKEWFKNNCDSIIQNEQIDMPPEQPPAIVRKSEHDAIKEKEYKLKRDYAEKIQEKVRQGLVRPYYGKAVTYLSLQRSPYVKYDDFKDLCEDLYDLSAMNKIKLFADEELGISFKWFDNEKQQWVETRTIDDFHRLKKLLDKIFKNKPEPIVPSNIGDYLPKSKQQPE